MKKSLFVAAIAALTIVSCKKTENVETTSADSAAVDSTTVVTDSTTVAVDSSAAGKVDSTTVKVDSTTTKK